VVLVALAVVVLALVVQPRNQTELLEVLTLVAAAVVVVVATLVLAAQASSLFATKELQHSHLSAQV
jgi:multisubunit Na+/H+ antiporter MnhB subunit